MNLLFDIYIALLCNIGFRLGFRRARCSRDYHKKNENYTSIETVTFKKHPQNEDGWFFKTGLYKCSHCGIIYTSSGFGNKEQQE